MSMTEAYGVHTDMGFEPTRKDELIDELEYPDLDERVAEARRALALIEQSQQADTLPRKFERLMEDMTVGMPDAMKAMAWKFANFGKDFSNRAHQETATALDNSTLNLLNGRRR